MIDEARANDREEGDVGDAQHRRPLPGLSEENDAAEDEGDADREDRTGPGGEWQPSERVGRAQDDDHQPEREDDRGRGQYFGPRGRTCGWRIRRHRGALAPERPRSEGHSAAMREAPLAPTSSAQRELLLSGQRPLSKERYTRKIGHCGDFQ